MLGLFDNKSPLDDSSSQWLFDAFAWSLENFGTDPFYNDTVLVLPSNEFFPGRVDSVPTMAGLIFDQVKGYAGISHWPTLISEQDTCPTTEQPQIEIKGALRGPKGIANETADATQRLLIPYNPQQINNPEGMIASFAHTLSHHLGQMANEPPPGGFEYWPQATELLAVYLGFGVMFANSAFSFRGGCGSCYNPNANRKAYLTELEATYALAIFAALKDIPNSAITKHLKKHLRGFYKASAKNIRAQQDELHKLKAVKSKMV
jgi:hypothetical protein